MARKRRQTIEVFQPDKGIKTDAPRHMTDPRAQLNGRDFKLYFGCNQKEYGTTLFNTGGGALGAPINHIDEAIYNNGTVLQVFTHTGVHRYSSGSDAVDISDGQTFTGTHTDYWSSVIHNDQFFYTNGVDHIQYKNTFSSTGTEMTSAVSPDTYKAWGLLSFREHLNLYHTIENGTEFIKRIRWTQKGVLTPSSGTTDFDLGTAGAIDVQDVEGEIQTATPVAGGAAVFGDRSIHIQFWVGGDEVYRFQKTVSGVGTPSRRGALTYKEVVYFVSHENFHAYHGGDDVRDIGEPIRQKAFSELNDSAISNCYVEADPQNDEILFHIPTAGELVDTVWVYGIDKGSWARQKRGYTAAGRSKRTTGLTIGELVGNIGDQNFTFGEAQISQDAVTRIYGDQSGRVVKYDPTVYSINNSGTTSPQTFVYESPDYTGANLVDPISGQKVDFTKTHKRFTQFHLDVAGNGTASVLYSTDRGVTFVPFTDSPITLVNSGTNHTLDLDADGRQIAYKVICSGTNDFIAIKQHDTEFVPTGEN